MIDLLVLAYIAFAAWRGRKRGLVVELPMAASSAIFFVTGCGLFNWMYRGLSKASALTGQSLGVFTFVGLIVASYILWRTLTARLGKAAGKYVTEHRHRLAGGSAGGVRALVLASTLLLILVHWPLHAFTRGLAEGSLFGRVLVRWVLPVYGKTHGAL